MGIKKFFKTKPPTQEQVESNIRESMMDRGLPVKHESKYKPNNFSAYNEYASDRMKQKKQYAPKGYSEVEKAEQSQDMGFNDNPYGGMDSAASINPYAAANTNSQDPSGANPYSQGSSTQSNPYGSSNAPPSYSSPGSQGGGPYGSLNSRENPYAPREDSDSPHRGRESPHNSGGERSENPNASQDRGNNPYASQGPKYACRKDTSEGPPPPSASQNPYAARSSLSERNPYARSNSIATNSSQRIKLPGQDQQNEFSFEPALETTVTRQTTQTYVPGQYQEHEFGSEELDLNDDHYADEDLNDNAYRDDVYGAHEQLQVEETEEERLLREEDEEVEQIKGQMRFTKQESVASTRNTLRMARDAEESGKNTMGMLGAQSETLFNTERNLRLAETQDKMSYDKIAQLKHYNRNILKIKIQNPYTKNRRLREQEDKIKADRVSSKYEQERARAAMADSSTRVKSSLDDGEGMGDEIANKYRREQVMRQAKQYQFEGDSEDDEMEAEIGENLSEIGKFAGRLKKLAVSQGDEIDRQNNRLREVEERTDKLDLNVHLNTAKLSTYRS